MNRTLLTAVALGLSLGCTSEPEAESTPGVFVLGVDGMDPVILQRLMDEGKMPAFSKLVAQGSFQELGTSWPPQSPVAWSNFVTGMNPGGHGIYDFIHRDPATYLPISSATPPSDAEPPGTISIGGYIIPLGGEDPVNNRGGVPFWDLLHASGVDTEIYRIPANYPVPESEAKVLGGMGTVDMRGDFGTYTLYSSQPVWNPEVKGDIELVQVVDTNLDGVRDKVRSKLKGPPDIFHLEPGQIPGPSDYLSVPLEVSLDPISDVVYVEVGGEGVVLKPGEWSDWVQVSFDALPYGVMPLSGTVRFYLKNMREPFVLYASPININPLDPAQPITSPDDFTELLSERLGPFYTQGMPEETNALKDGVFDDDDYELQVGLVQKDTELMLDMALERFDSGDMSFVYVSDVDLQCHMLWRHGDPKYGEDEPRHPAHEEASAKDHVDDIEGYYQSVDALLAKTLAELPEDTLLMVMSDHGFQPYTRKFHLNNWLVQEGYLVLKETCDDAGVCAPAAQGSIAADHVDWSQTRAYGLGFNGLYLNLSGREGQGIVAPGDSDGLLAEISQKLLAVTDDERAGAALVKSVVKAPDVYTGSRVAEAPDLIIGYDKHYGASDETTLGEIVNPDEHPVLEDNLDRWSGNHLMAPEVVPGVLIVNRKVGMGEYELVDLTATLLDYYGLPLSEGMVGESILGN